MKPKTSIFGIITIQAVLDIIMWYFALTDAHNYEAYWAVLLAVNMMLVGLVMLIILRYYIKRSELDE